MIARARKIQGKPEGQGARRFPRLLILTVALFLAAVALMADEVREEPDFVEFRIKELDPDCNVYVLYKDMRTYGFSEVFYTEARE